MSISAAQDAGALLRGDRRHRGENVAVPRAGLLDRVGPLDPVADRPFGDIQIREALVEVLLCGGGVAAHLGGVGGEDRGHRRPGAVQQRQGDASQPLVEVGQHAPMTRSLGLEGVAAHRLQQAPHRVAEAETGVQQGVGPAQVEAQLLGEPLSDIRHPFRVHRVLQQDQARPPGHQPAAVVAGDALPGQILEGPLEPAHGVEGLELDGGVLGHVRAHHVVGVAPALDHDRRLGAQDRVDPADRVAGLPGDLEEQRPRPAPRAARPRALGRFVGHHRGSGPQTVQLLLTVLA